MPCTNLSHDHQPARHIENGTNDKEHPRERRTMTRHMTGTREEWLAARLELLEAEKELTRRSDVRSCRGSGSTRSTDSRPMKGAPRWQTSSEGARTTSSTTPIPPMRADWTASGACTSGSTAPPRGATRRRAASGGAATTSTTSAERSRGCRGATGGREISRRMVCERSFPASLLRRLGAAFGRQRGGDDPLVRVHVGDGRDADAWRLDDGDGVADARTDVARRPGVVPRHVGRDDGSDDAAI